jgi:hypothetical protein
MFSRFSADFSVSFVKIKVWAYDLGQQLVGQWDYHSGFKEMRIEPLFLDFIEEW